MPEPLNLIPPHVAYPIYHVDPEYPGRFVCRRWWWHQGDQGHTVDNGFTLVSSNIDLIREMLATMQLHAVEPRGEDDPAILEIWL